MPSAAIFGPWPSTLHLLPRLLIALCAAIAVAVIFGKDVVMFALPYARAAIPWLDDRFAVVVLELARTQQDTVIALRVVLVKAVLLNGHVAYTDPEGRIDVSTPIGDLLQPGVIALTVALAWPRGVWVTMLAGVLALAGACALFVADLPLTLLAFVWDMFHAHFDPDGFSPLLIWHDFMRSGGRLALGACIGAVATVVASRVRFALHR